MLQAQTRADVVQGVLEHGVAPGGRKMMDGEEAAAELAIQTGIYGVYRPCASPAKECTRVGPSSRCFCGHAYSQHTFIPKTAAYPRCSDCHCTAFAFVPSRPEEVGEWWLVRRKGFNVHTWRAKCRCGHSHEEHDPKHRRCSCGCPRFVSNFACLVCDQKWEDHETVFENALERVARGAPIGDAFRPLANDPTLREAVFPRQEGAGSGTGPATTPNLRLRPAAVPAARAEKGVRTMHASSGGQVRDQPVTNRYGRVAAPPPAPLHNSPGALSQSTNPGAQSQQMPRTLASGFRPVYD